MLTPTVEKVAAHLNMEIDPDLHLSAKHAALDAGTSLRKWVEQAIREKLERDEHGRR